MSALEDVDPLAVHKEDLDDNPDFNRIRSTMSINIATRCGQVPDLHPRLHEAVNAAAIELAKAERAAGSQPPDFPRARLDRWVTAPAAGAPSLSDFLLARYAEDEEADLVEPEDWGFVGDPSKSRSFADIEAKRRIVEMEWHHLGDDDYAWGMEEAKRQILAVLALPYADHPDYREEWKT